MISERISDDMPPQMTNWNMVIPILMYFSTLKRFIWKVRMIQRILHQCNNWYILIFLLHNALARSTHYVTNCSFLCIMRRHFEV